MDKIGRGALQMAPEMLAGYNIFMKCYLRLIFVLSIMIGGCAAQHHPASSSSATNPTPSVSEHKSSGWYLMQPPVHHGNLDTAARLANWEVLAYFEHASQCDAARQKGLVALWILSASVRVHSDGFGAAEPAPCVIDALRRGG